MFKLLFVLLLVSLVAIAVLPDFAEAQSCRCSYSCYNGYIPGGGYCPYDQVYCCSNY